MKTKSIVYNSFVPNAEITPAISQDKSPSFKYTGYKPRYKWSDDDSTEVISTSSPKEESDPESDQITFQDPTSIDWSKIAGYENQPIITESQSTTPVTRPRGKHVFKDPSIQVGEMQGLLDAFADAGISLRITSGTRPGARTKQGKLSNHALGRALDITPVEGQTFEDLAEAIRNSPDLVAYMKEHGYGIYDETTPEALTRTGGTGAHWHLGPDDNAIKGLETILKGKQGLKIPILFAKDGIKTQRYGTRKEQKRNDRVTEMILQESNKKNQNISPITGLRYEEPLQPLGLEIVSFIPGVGDAIETGNIVNNAISGNIGSALLGASLFLIPGNIPTIIKNFKKPAEGMTRLYRANPHNPTFNVNKAANGEAQRQFAGQWFTTDPEKTAWYAHQYLKGRNAFNSSDLQYVDIPTKDLEKYRASNILPKEFDFEPEDFIIPENMERTTFPSGIRKEDNYISEVIPKIRAAWNPVEIKTYLIDRLDKETLSRLNLPNTINGKSIKDVLNDIPIEIGNAAHKGGAYYDSSLNKIIIDKDFPIEMYGEAIDHELLHALDYLSKNNIQKYSGDVSTVIGSRNLYQKTIGNDDIFTSELAAKLVQLKNKAGLSKNKNLTGNQWKELVQNYSSDPKYNGISQLLDQVKDWDKLASWAQKAVPTFIPIMAIPSVFNNGNDKKEVKFER